MCAHSQGQVVNYSKIGQALDQTHPTIKSHIDILRSTFMMTTLSPWEANVKKRLVKSPKVYLRDQGLFCSLMGISSFEDLFNHPSYGLVWEGFAIEQIITRIGREPFGYFRTHTGDEIDLLFRYQGKTHAVEFKTSKSPKVSSKIETYLEKLSIDSFWVLAPEVEKYPIFKGKGTVLSLNHFLEESFWQS